MTDVDLELSLYDMNKQVMASLEPMDAEDIEDRIDEIVDWFICNSDTYAYYMLLCHERRDYTLFNFIEAPRETAEFAGQELLETLENRGDILDIDFEEEGCCSIWIRDKENENCLYHLFPYDSGVIEV